MPPLNKDEPAILEIGTEVSARFNGAFCEAKVKSITMDLRMRVKDPGTDETFLARNPNILTDIPSLRIGGEARVRHPNKTDQVNVTINQIFDYSSYLVEFNDGDTRTVKRSLLHQKSGKHFDESLSLDNLPLTQPEKSSTSFPSASTSRADLSLISLDRSQSVASAELETDESDKASMKRGMRTTRRAVPVKSASLKSSRAGSESSQTDKNSTDETVDSNGRGRRAALRKKPVFEPLPKVVEDAPIRKRYLRKRPTPDLVKESSVESATPEAVSILLKKNEFPVRSAVRVPQIGRKRFKWLAALVIHPENRMHKKVDPNTELLVRIFGNSIFRKVPLNQVRPFTEANYSGPGEDRVQKFEPDYALAYLQNQTLPPTWGQSLFSPADIREGSEETAAAEREASSAREDAEDESEATRFMIEFIKYCDVSGKPYDSPPRVGETPVDMYQLHRAVHEAGGYNRCNQENKWLEICEELELRSGDKGQDLKNIYATYLHGGFEQIFRNLGNGNIDNIRLGRKRHQPIQQQESVVEPERRVHSPFSKKPRGRPPTRVKTEDSTPDRKSEETTAEAKPEMMTTAANSREISVDRAPPTRVIDETWAAIRREYAADAAEISDTSVLRPGAVVIVFYRNDKQKKVVNAYEARILDSVGDVAFYVHYSNWNKRYDEWVPLQAIVSVGDVTEVGAKQYLPNPAFQTRIRSKLRGVEWTKWRSALERYIGVAEESKVAEGDDDSASTSKLKVPKRGGRKRSLSIVAASKDGEVEEKKADSVILEAELKLEEMMLEESKPEEEKVELVEKPRQLKVRLMRRGARRKLTAEPPAEVEKLAAVPEKSSSVVEKKIEESETEKDEAELTDTSKTRKRGRPVKKKKLFQPKLPKSIVLNAPAFASKHSDALARLGLPLDGSEGSGLTEIVEDELGNIVKLIIEGVDLTDPDYLPESSLEGISKIEAYEQNLVNTMLVSQLLIHRLATGYHIIKRVEDRDADGGHQSDAKSDKSEPALRRQRSLRNK